MNVIAATDANPILLGLRLYELLTLVGIILGPIVAVVVTIVAEKLRSRREQRLVVFRALLATFRLSSDASYSVAMNMILIEFHDHPSVISARREYMSVVRQRPGPGHEEAHFEQTIIKQIALVYQVAKSLGFKITEGELRSEVYIADGMVARENVLIDSQRAMRDVATALQRQVQLTEAIVAGSPSQQTQQ